MKLRDLERHLRAHHARMVAEGARHTKWRSERRCEGDSVVRLGIEPEQLKAVEGLTRIDQICDHLVRVYAPGHVRWRYLFVTAAIALSAFSGRALAAQPCGEAVIGDWYDNGVFDRTWDCECFREAIDSLSEMRPPYSSARDDFRRQMGLQLCDGSSQQVLTATLAPIATAHRDESREWRTFLPIAILAMAAAALASWILRRQRREA